MFRRKNFFSFILAIGILFFSAQFATPAQAAEVVIAQGVVSYDTGLAASGIIVELHNGDGSFYQSTTTIIDGSYSISAEQSTIPTAVDLTLEVRDLPDGLQKPESYNFRYTGVSTSKNFSLTTVNKQIQVTVHDEEGVPVAAQVTAQPIITGTSNENMTQTQDDFSTGTGTLYVDGGRSYAVVADANLSETNPAMYPWIALTGAQQVTFADDATTEIMTLDFTVARANNLVAITMVDADGSILTENSFRADLSVNGIAQGYGNVSTRRKVNTEGVAQMYLPPGIYSVTAFHQQLDGQSFDPVEATIVVPNDASGDSYAFGPIQAYTNNGSISGTVTDGANDHALPNVNVTITELRTGAHFSGTTNASGQFAINNVSRGEFSIFVDQSGYVTTQAGNAKITTDNPTVSNIGLVAYANDMTVIGELDLNGNAINDVPAVVTLTDNNGSKFTASVETDGTYSIDVPTALVNGKNLELSVATQSGADVFATEIVNVPVQTGTQTQNITVSDDEGTINGQLKDDDGNILTITELGDAAKVVALNQITGSVEEALVSDDGTYELNVGAGQWQLMTEVSDKDAVAFGTLISEQKVNVTAGEILSNKDIQLAVTEGVVTGMVKDNVGTAVAGALIHVSNLSDLQEQADLQGRAVDPSDIIDTTVIADKQGEFTTNLPAGKFTASFVSTPGTEDLVEPNNQIFTVKDGDTTTLSDAAFDQADATLTGTIKDLEGASVVVYSQNGGSQSLEVASDGSFSEAVSTGAVSVIISGVRDNELFVGQQDLTLKEGGNTLTSNVQTTGIDFPAAVAITGNASDTLSIANEAGARVDLPAFAAGITGDVTLELVPRPDIVFDGETAQLGLAYDVKATLESGDTTLPIHALNEEAIITLPIPDALDGGVDTSELTPTYYNDETETYLRDGMQAKTDGDEMVIHTKHLTRFAVTSAGDLSLNAPTTPTKLKVKKITNQSATLTWRKGEGVVKTTKFTVQVRKFKDNKEVRWLEYTNVKQARKAITDLIAKQVYQFRVQACKGAVCSGYSNWKKFRTKH